MKKKHQYVIVFIGSQDVSMSAWGSRRHVLSRLREFMSEAALFGALTDMEATALFEYESFLMVAAK